MLEKAVNPSLTPMTQYRNLTPIIKVKCVVKQPCFIYLLM